MARVLQRMFQPFLIHIKSNKEIGTDAATSVIFEFASFPKKRKKKSFFANVYIIAAAAHHLYGCIDERGEPIIKQK